MLKTNTKYPFKMSLIVRLIIEKFDQNLNVIRHFGSQSRMSQVIPPYLKFKYMTHSTYQKMGHLQDLNVFTSAINSEPRTEGALTGDYIQYYSHLCTVKTFFCFYKKCICSNLYGI